MDVSDFTDNLVKFLAHRVTQAKTVWINEKALRDLDGNEWDYKNFTYTFGYANKNSGCFLHIDFDGDDGKVLYAERYGGIGVGTNGGGVRCGNIGNFQLKGTGINQMLGDHDDLDHSSGNYPLFEAMTEVINAQIYNQILPLGTATSYGLIFTGLSAHMREPYAKKQPLALMVREACLRPAHFLRQPYHRPLYKYRLSNKDDAARVRAVNRALGEKFANHNDFIMYLGKFLGNSANQLAFAKIFRIAHGAFSPSNVALDGRWLDLTNMTMVPTGTNYVAAKDLTPFLSEVRTPLNIVDDILYTYGKYNYMDLNIAPLSKYYFEQYNSYCFYYVVRIFGIDTDAIDVNSTMLERQVLSKSIANILVKDMQPKIGFPNDEGRCDPLIPLVESLFMSLVNTAASSKTSDNNIEAAEAFTSLIILAYKNNKRKNLTFAGFVSSSMIKSLRKLYFASFFYLGRMHKAIKDFIGSIDPEHEAKEIATYIELYSDMAAWLFDQKDIENEIYIFYSKSLSILYHPESKSFSLQKNGDSSKKTFSLSSELSSEIQLINNSAFIIAGYCFKAGIISMLNVLFNVGAVAMPELLENKENV